MDIITAFNQCAITAAATRSKATSRTYRNGMDQFATYLETKNILPTSPLESIKIEYFIGFPIWLLAQGLSKSTTQVYVSGVKFFMDALVIDGIISPNYQELLRYKAAAGQVNRKHEDKLIRTPQKDAVEKIIKAVHNRDVNSPIKERDISLIEFLVSTGCRNNEVVQLLVKHIDIVERSAIVTGKGNKERIVFFSPMAAFSLKNYWSARGYSDSVHPAFARHDVGTGKRIHKLTTTTIRNIVDECVVLAGLDKGTFTPHYFRHAFAIKMLHETHDLALVQDLMGHKDPASTRVYAKIMPDDLKEAHRMVYK